MDIADIMKRLRRVDNLAQFARDSRVSRATLYRMLGGWGQNPTLKTLQQIEAALDMAPKHSKERK